MSFEKGFSWMLGALFAIFVVFFIDWGELLSGASKGLGVIVYGIKYFVITYPIITGFIFLMITSVLMFQGFIMFPMKKRDYNDFL